MSSPLSFWLFPLHYHARSPPNLFSARPAGSFILYPRLLEPLTCFDKLFCFLFSPCAKTATSPTFRMLAVKSRYYLLASTSFIPLSLVAVEDFTFSPFFSPFACWLVTAYLHLFFLPPLEQSYTDPLTGFDYTFAVPCSQFLPSVLFPYARRNPFPFLSNSASAP